MMVASRNLPPVAMYHTLQYKHAPKEPTSPTIPHALDTPITSALAAAPDPLTPHCTAALCVPPCHMLHAVHSALAPLSALSWPLCTRVSRLSAPALLLTCRSAFNLCQSHVSVAPMPPVSLPSSSQQLAGIRPRPLHPLAADLVAQPWTARYCSVNWSAPVMRKRRPCSSSTLPTARSASVNQDCGGRGGGLRVGARQGARLRQQHCGRPLPPTPPSPACCRACTHAPAPGTCLP